LLNDNFKKNFLIDKLSQNKEFQRIPKLYTSMNRNCW